MVETLAKILSTIIAYSIPAIKIIIGFVLLYIWWKWRGRRKENKIKRDKLIKKLSEELKK